MENNSISLKLAAEMVVRSIKSKNRQALKSFLDGYSGSTATIIIITAILLLDEEETGETIDLLDLFNMLAINLQLIEKIKNK